MVIKYQDDGHGNEVTVDGSNGVQTKKQAEANPNTGGAQINASQKFNGRLQQGQATADEAAAKESQAMIENFMGELDRLRSVTSAGRPVDNKTLESLQHRLNDTAMAWVKGGGKVNDDAMVNLRSYVDNISQAARSNAR